MSKNNYPEAIGLLLSGKSMKPVLIKIAQGNPAVFIRAFKACYGEQEKSGEIQFIDLVKEFNDRYGDPEKPKLSTNDPRILQLIMEGRKIEAIKKYRELYGTNLKEAKEAVEKLMAESKFSR